MPTRSRSSGPFRVGARSDVSHLLNEIGLRVVKAGIALLLGIVLYWFLTGPMGTAGSVELALLSWLSAAAFVLLVETGLF